MSFRITGLPAAPFERLYGLSTADLAAHGVERVIADAPSCYPDRIEMRDAKVGEALLLLNHTHQPANSPYRASHAIFVLEGATESYDAEGEVPEVMAHRLLSLRAFDGADKIAEARVAPGAEAAAAITEIFANPRIRYIHAHNAAQGCFSGLIRRV